MGGWVDLPDVVEDLDLGVVVGGEVHVVLGAGETVLVVLLGVGGGGEVLPEGISSHIIHR